MEHYSIVDHSIVDRPVSERSASDRAGSEPGSPRPGAEPEPEAAELEPELELGLEQEVPQSRVNRSWNPALSSSGVANPSVAAGIAAANALAAAGMAGEAGGHVGPRFPGEDGAHSLAEMAQRDLDAALQLLADRAQYITGAGGAAIALRRDESNDMLCRASSGAKAPELGALLSTESGLSGESVRTRMPLRCDDTERDPRVNQESCRRLGIAAVMIVPIVGQDSAGDDQVLGVFELFSGQAGVFEERDLSALQRLGEMVETAVKLARAARGVPPEMVAPDMAIDAADLILPDQAPSDLPAEITTEVTEEHTGTTGKPLLSSVSSGIPASAVFADDDHVLEVEIEETAAEPPREAALAGAVAGAGVEAGAEAAMTAATAVDSADPALPPQSIPAALPAAVPPPAVIPPASNPPADIPAAAVAPVAATEQPAKRPLMWSAAAAAGPEAVKAAEMDQSHVPPMLRNLRKCKACGFPVSEGRTLCVECDEKQWRGQPLPAAGMGRVAGAAAVDFRQTAALDAPSLGIASAKGAPVAANLTSEGDTVPGETLFPASPAAFSSGPQSLFAAASERTERGTRAEAARGPIAVAAGGAGASLGASSVKASGQTSGHPSGPPSAQAADATRPGMPVLVEPVRQARENPASPNFSGGLGTSESWLARNKYVLGAILLIAALLAAVAWLR